MLLRLPSLHCHIMSHTPREGFSIRLPFPNSPCCQGRELKAKAEWKKIKNQGTKLFFAAYILVRNENQSMWKTINCTSHHTQRNIYWLLPTARGDGRSTGSGEFEGERQRGREIEGLGLILVPYHSVQSAGSAAVSKLKLTGSAVATTSSQ